MSSATVRTRLILSVSSIWIFQYSSMILSSGVVRKARLSGRYGPNATGWLLTGLGPHCREKKSKVGHQAFRRSTEAR